MFFNAYNELSADPAITKLVGNGYLILEYKCPIEVDNLDVLLEQHFITYVISGKKDWITGDRTVHVKEGDAIFLRKGVYTIHQYFDVDHCVLVFFLQDDFICNFLRENVTHFPENHETIDEKIFALDVDESLQSLFYSIYSYLKKGTEVPRNLVELKFKELLFNIVLNPKHKKLAQFLASLNQPGLALLDDVMMKNFHHDLDLEEFARLCGRSLSAFRRDFKSVYHETPARWLNNKRLELACSLLLGSGLNVNEIGFESGFRNSSHFNKAFKEKYQTTPKQFRLMHRPSIEQIQQK
ncbi:MAG TPA: AraC family transcriptional regulator [Chryseolinea sp.]